MSPSESSRAERGSEKGCSACQVRRRRPWRSTPSPSKAIPPSWLAAEARGREPTGGKGRLRDQLTTFEERSRSACGRPSSDDPVLSSDRKCTRKRGTCCRGRAAVSGGDILGFHILSSFSILLDSTRWNRSSTLLARFKNDTRRRALGPVKSAASERTTRPERTRPADGDPGTFPWSSDRGERSPHAVPCLSVKQSDLSGGPYFLLFFPFLPFFGMPQSPGRDDT